MFGSTKRGRIVLMTMDTNNNNGLDLQNITPTPKLDKKYRPCNVSHNTSLSTLLERLTGMGSTEAR